MQSRQLLTDLTYMGGTRPCGPMTIIFRSVIQSQHTSLYSSFGVNRTIHVLKTTVTDLTYMGVTRPCGPMTIIFRSVIQSQHTSLNITFGVTCTLHLLSTTVYRFDLYGRYQTLWIDDDNFSQPYLELAYKPTYQFWCESGVPCTQDPSLRILLISEVPDPVDR